MYAHATELFPICRSITGKGVRDTLASIRGRLPNLRVVAVPSGTKVNDWVVPDEWNVNEAFVESLDGHRVIDFADHNLHLVNYSVPFTGTVEREELLRHIHTIPDAPNLIPYRTSYYQRNWGFCLQHDRLDQLVDAEYRVVVDSTLEAGELNYGELYVRGRREEEIVFSTHICHPSLANDNLSGIAMMTELARYVDELPDRKYSYRFLYVPGTIGAIAWLAGNADVAARIGGMVVVALVGAAGPLHYKTSPDRNERVDRIVRRVLRQGEYEHVVRDFSPYGYDERQYGSPGYRIPVGSLTRRPYGEYPEYHTSADNLDLIDAVTLEESLRVYKDVVNAFEREEVYHNRYPYGEPQLGRRGLYDQLGGGTTAAEDRMAMLWILNLSDGSHSLTDIAERSGIDESDLRRVAAILEDRAVIDRGMNVG